MNIVKLDMLGVEPYVEGRIAELIDCASYELEADDYEVAMEALSYCILHIAKMNRVTTSSCIRGRNKLDLAPFFVLHSFSG